MLHSTPSAQELVAAVREFLREEVMPSMTGPVSFHARVAANVLAQVERELQFGPESEARAAEALAALGVADERTLAEAIRHGRRGLDDGPTIAALRQLTLDRLSVSNPAYPDHVIGDDPRVEP